MKKISVTDAYQHLDKDDLKVLEIERHLLFNSEERKGREMTQQFFLDESGDIYLEIYWDDDIVQILRFTNEGEESEKDSSR